MKRSRSPTPYEQLYSRKQYVPDQPQGKKIYVTKTHLQYGGYYQGYVKAFDNEEVLENFTNGVHHIEVIYDEFYVPIDATYVTVTLPSYETMANGMYSEFVKDSYISLGLDLPTPFSTSPLNVQVPIERNLVFPELIEQTRIPVRTRRPVVG